MQPLFIFRRASTGLAPAPKTLARTAFLLAQIAATAPPQAHRNLPTFAARITAPGDCQGEPAHARQIAPGAAQQPMVMQTHGRMKKPAHGRFSLLVQVADHSASVTA